MQKSLSTLAERLFIFIGKRVTADDTERRLP